MIRRRNFLTTCALVAGTTALPNFALANEQTRILNWRSMTIPTVAKKNGHRAPVVTGLSVRPNHTEIAIVGDDHFISIYDQETNRFMHHLGDHDDWVRAARYSPNGEYLVTAGNDRRLLLWEANQYESASRISTHRNAIIDVAFSPDGQKLATVGFEDQLRIYNVANQQPVTRFTCECDDNHAVAFSLNGQFIAAGGRSGVIRVWEMLTGRQVSEFQAHRNRVRSIEFNQLGQIVSSGEDQIVRLTDPNHGAEPMRVARQTARVFDSHLINDTLVATGCADNQVHIWSIADSQYVGTLKGHTGTVSCLDSTQTQLISGSYDTNVRIWTLQNEDIQGLRHTKLNPGWNQRIK